MTYVNIGLDNKYYTNIIKLEEEDAVTAIVNKYHSLSSNYIPKNLQNVKYGSGKLRKDAKEAFDKMCDAARKDKIYIAGGSGYRSIRMTAESTFGAGRKLPAVTVNSRSTDA